MQMVWNVVGFMFICMEMVFDNDEMGCESSDVGECCFGLGCLYSNLMGLFDWAWDDNIE